MGFELLLMLSMLKSSSSVHDKDSAFLPTVFVSLMSRMDVKGGGFSERKKRWSVKVATRWIKNEEWNNARAPNIIRKNMNMKKIVSNEKDAFYAVDLRQFECSFCYDNITSHTTHSKCTIITRFSSIHHSANRHSPCIRIQHPPSEAYLYLYSCNNIIRVKRAILCFFHSSVRYTRIYCVHCIHIVDTESQIHHQPNTIYHIHTYNGCARKNRTKRLLDR